MGVGGDLLVGKTAELGADHLHLVVEPARAIGRGTRRRADERDKARARRGRVAALEQRRDRGLGHQRRDLGRRRAQIAQPHEFALVHRDAARDLRQILARADLEDQRLDLAEGPGLGQTVGPGRHLHERFGIGCEPRQPMRRRLPRLEQRGVDPARGGDLGAQPLGRARGNRRDGGAGGARVIAQTVENGGKGGDGLSVVGHGTGS